MELSLYDGEREVNIFYLHPCAAVSASYMHDKHVVKMIVESAQLLSTAAQMVCMERDTRLYKPCYINHPCAVWTRLSVDNYEWLYQHYISLIKIYEFTYNDEHRSAELMKALKEYLVLMPKTGFTEPPLCMPDEYKVPNVSHYISYRKYYLAEKAKKRHYRRIKPPYWVQEYHNARSNHAIETTVYLPTKSDLEELSSDQSVSDET
jgi:hypothetical protein